MIPIIDPKPGYTPENIEILASKYMDEIHEKQTRKLWPKTEPLISREQAYQNLVNNFTLDEKLFYHWWSQLFGYW